MLRRTGERPNALELSQSTGDQASEIAAHENAWLKVCARRCLTVTLKFPCPSEQRNGRSKAGDPLGLELVVGVPKCAVLVAITHYRHQQLRLRQALGREVSRIDAHQ